MPATSVYDMINKTNACAIKHELCIILVKKRKSECVFGNSQYIKFV